MDTKSRRQKGQDGALSALNAAIVAVQLAEKIPSIPLVKGALGLVGSLLTMIRDSMINKWDYVELGLFCADICKALGRGMDGKRLDELSQSLVDAINQLTTTVAEIQKDVIERSRRNIVSRVFRANGDTKMIATWKSDLDRVLQVFNTELAMNTHVTVVGIRHDVSKILETGDQVRSAQPSISPGELLPPLPRACVGRDELIDEIVGLATNLTSIALIGAGGIGKTSIALAVLHDDRIKERFGVNRRFVPCDQFPVSHVHFLRRLSEVIGAGIENPEDLTPLRPFLSSREMILFLDNAESILDPQGADTLKIRAVVEELSRFGNICLSITSRIRTVPSHCKRLIVPTLPMESACDIFYGIYNNGGRSSIINDLVRRLDFHALSITLLATVASNNVWDYDRLASEWDDRRTQILRTDYDEGLAATIELSLTSPTFCKLGPDARDLLGVIAFFPQGIDENLDWLFPSVSDKKNIFDQFCLLSLTYRSNGFVTMLAPFRDYLCPKSPKFSPLLHMTKEHYLRKLLVEVDPSKPGPEDAQWIVSEDVNVEHLLNVFTSIDANLDGIWLACAQFMRHLYRHKRRLVVLGPKIEGLHDDHPSKPECLHQLSRLFNSVGNDEENKRLLIHTLRLWRGWGNGLRVAQTLKLLADTNWQLQLYKEGISQAREALEIYKRHNDITGQAQSLQVLARLLDGDKQLDAAETAVSRAMDLFSITNDQFNVCKCHRVLSRICRSKGKTEEAINHLETALRIASSSNRDGQLFWIHYSLARLFSDQDRLDDAHVHIERAKPYAVDVPYNLGRAMKLQARLWYKQRRLKEAESEALRAADVFKGLGGTNDLERCRELLRDIEEEVKKPVASGEPGSNTRGIIRHLASLFRRVLPRTTNTAPGQRSNSRT